MHKIARVFVSYGVYTSWLFLSLLVLPFCCLLALLPARMRYQNRFYFWLTSRYSWLLVHATGVNVRMISGSRFPLDANQPCIIIMNHTSALDIPLMEMLLGPHPRIWLSKLEYGKMPFIGFLLKRLHVMVNRANAREAVTALLKTVQLAKDYGSNVVMFPEGTRHGDEQLHDFHRGFAIIACKLGRPVVPIITKNASKVLPPRSWLIDSWRTPIKIGIGPAIWPTADQTPEQFCQQVWQVCNDLHQALL